MNTDFENDFFMLINYAVFWKTMENERNYRGVKVITTETRMNYLVLELDHHTTNIFFR